MTRLWGSSVEEDEILAAGVMDELRRPGASW